MDPVLLLAALGLAALLFGAAGGAELSSDQGPLPGRKKEEGGGEKDPLATPPPSSFPPPRPGGPVPSGSPASSPRGPAPAAPSPSPVPDPTPPSPPGEVIQAIVEELASQAPEENRDELRQTLLGHLSRGNASGAQLAIPVEFPGAPSLDDVKRIALTLASSYGWSSSGKGGARVDLFDVKAPGAEERRKLSLVTIGDLPIEVKWIRGPNGESFGRRESFGGILGFVFQTVAASAIGTVTSMGVSDLVRSMGGEPRLARLMRHYNAAVSRGDSGAAARIRSHVTHTASRIKGRRVDWSEVEQLSGSSRSGG